MVLTPLASYLQLTQAVCVLVIFLFAVHLLSFIYTGASLDWRLGRGSVCNKRIFRFHYVSTILPPKYRQAENEEQKRLASQEEAVMWVLRTSDMPAWTCPVLSGAVPVKIKLWGVISKYVSSNMDGFNQSKEIFIINFDLYCKELIMLWNNLEGTAIWWL